MKSPIAYGIGCALLLALGSAHAATGGACESGSDAVASGRAPAVAAAVGFYELEHGIAHLQIVFVPMRLEPVFVVMRGELSKELQRGRRE